MRDVTLVILNSLRIKCHIRRSLKLLSKLICILRITFCYKQLCGSCLVHMGSQGGNTLRICTIISKIY